MNRIWTRRNIMILIAALALVVSGLWTASSIRMEDSATPTPESILSITPDYTLTTRQNVILWPSGTRLPQGLAAYFYVSRPELKVAPDIVLKGLVEGSLQGTSQTKILVQSVNEDGLVYWSYPVQGPVTQAFLLRPGTGETAVLDKELVPLPVLDVAAIHDQVVLITEELEDNNGTIQLVLDSRIEVKGKVNGQAVDKTLSWTLPITLDGNSFQIPELSTVAASVSFTPEVIPPTLFQRIQTALIENWLVFAMDFLVLLILIVLLSTGRDTRKKAKSAVEHRKFREWITEGSVEIKDRFVINILGLEGLVDLAIDLDKRVIFDSRIRKYYVLADDIVYAHDPDYKAPSMANKPQLGKLLLERQLLRPEQLETGLYYQQRIGSRLGESLIALGFIDETTLYSTLAAQQNVVYYEVDPNKEITDLSWTSVLNLKTARALQVLPLGRRSDGAMIIACSEPGKEGVRNALKEIFGNETILVAARPSTLYQILDRLEGQEEQTAKIKPLSVSVQIPPYESLTDEERDVFIASYYRGNIQFGLFMKAAGFADHSILSQAPEQEALVPWLVNRKVIDGRIANMMKGLLEATEAMDFNTRQEKGLPSLLELLQYADYLTNEAAEWAKLESKVQNLSLEKLLTNNFMASSDTIQIGRVVLSTMASILNKSTLKDAQEQIREI